MNPLLLLGLGGLALFALAKAGSAKALSTNEAKAKANENKATQNAVEALATLKRQYAQSLLSYVNGGGTKAATIKSYQKKIGAKTTGKPDTQTEKKIESILGYDVSWAPKKKVVNPKVYTPTNTSAIKSDKKAVSKETSKPQPVKVVKPTAVKVAPSKTPQTEQPKLLTADTQTRAPRFTSIPNAVPDSVLAATGLDGYLKSGGLDRTRVKEYQRRMGGGLAIDGVPGPKTKARAETLLNRQVSWPAQDAAADLADYYRNGGRDRSKIKAFQNAMGELTVDGQVGPATKKRYTVLTGKNF
jgi:hypothetical protein